MCRYAYIFTKTRLHCTHFFIFNFLFTTHYEQWTSFEGIKYLFYHFKIASDSIVQFSQYPNLDVDIYNVFTFHYHKQQGFLFWGFFCLFCFVFWADSTSTVEPNTGPELMILRSRLEPRSRVRCLTDWATQAPLNNHFRFNLCIIPYFWDT